MSHRCPLDREIAMADRKSPPRAESYTKLMRQAFGPAAKSDRYDALYLLILEDPETVLRQCQQKGIPLQCLSSYRRAQGTHPDLMRELADTARSRNIPVVCPGNCVGCLADRPA